MKKSKITDDKEKISKKRKSILPEKLGAPEFRYRRLFESTKDGILILDAETGKIVDVNPFLIDLLGYSKKEFIEKSIWEIGAFQDIIENKDKFLELQQKEYVRYEDLPLETSDGSKILVEFVSNVYLVNNHKVIQCQIHDITARKETEAALEKTANELAGIKKTADELNKFTENIIDTVREPLLAIDKDLRVIKASRSFYTFFKVTAGETIDKRIYELGNHQWDIPKLRELLEKIIPEKKTFDNYEVEHDFSTIGKRVMLLNARQVKRAFGKEQIILLTIEDITERKGKEDTLKETHRATSDFLNILLNHMHAPIIIWDASFVIKHFNRKFEQLSGYDSAEVIGKEIDFLLPKEKIAATREMLKNHLDDEHLEVVEIDILTKDNKIRTVLWNSARIFDEEGKNIIATISQDITSRKRIQNELKFQSDLINNVGQAVIATDLLGKVIFWNNAAEKIYGWSSSEAIGQNIMDLTPARQSNEQAVEIMNKLSAGKTWTGEFHVKRKDGSSFPAFVTDTPILDSNGKFTGIIGISSDITERKRAEMELIEAKEKAEESDRLKTAFLNNVSHEIRTPMNAIVGFSQFLEDPQLSHEKRKQYTGIITQSSDQLLAIIDDIISIASIEAGQEKIKENEININLICELLKKQFFQKANDKNVTLRLKTTLADDDATFITDATKLTQIITNLVGNALKFTQQGSVNFGYTLKNSQLEFFVEDSGIGIPPDMHEIIFNRFRQVETTAKRNFGGSGLGLSISKSYVEMLGGKMWLTSELGKGSVFYFTIPYKKVNQEKLPDIPSIKDLRFEFKTLLIAEDENSNFLLLEELFSEMDINIIRAVNGIEAVELCKSNPHIDLVLMDLKMPEMDGYEATIKIKEFKPDLCIIAQTAYSTEADRNKALACGCSDFISKPINKELFLSKIYEQLL